MSSCLELIELDIAEIKVCNIIAWGGHGFSTEHCMRVSKSPRHSLKVAHTVEHAPQVGHGVDYDLR